MILVGIDVAEDKHDCFIQTVDGKVLFKSFFQSYEGFEELYVKILSCNDADIKVRLEVTRHYSYNFLGFLLSKELATFLKKNLDEGKHYFVALSYVAEKLIRVIFHLQKTGESLLDFA